jgi:hypothetical protein
MQSTCLYPFAEEKQTALLSVLEPLMARAGSVSIVEVEQVCHPMLTFRKFL